MSRRAASGRCTLSVAVGALLLSACAVGPDFRRPPTPAAGEYSSQGLSPGTEGGPAAQQLAVGGELPGEWWQLFRSPALQDAVSAALSGSPTLAAANATLAAAGEEVAVARAALLPRVDASASAQHASGSQLTQPDTNQYSLGFSAVYALDVFGGARRGVEQQRALADSQRYQLAAAYLTLTGSVVDEALTIASVRLQIATTEELIDSDRKNLALTQREFEVGTVARGDVLTADSQLAADLTQLPTLRQQLTAAHDALAVLTGRSPAQWQSREFDLAEFAVPAQIPVSLPSQLVRQRPDVLVSEAQLHAASAAIGIAKAQEFPSLTLTGSLGRSAFQPGQLFHQFDTLRDVGGALTVPLFAGGALRAQTRAARDQYQAENASYQAVVLEALGQVTDDLWALQHDAERLEVFRHSTEIAAQALKLQQSSYKAGKSNILQLIDAQRTYAQARLGLATAQVQQLQDTAGLLVALGGGWWQDAAAVRAGDAPL